MDDRRNHHTGNGFCVSSLNPSTSTQEKSDSTSFAATVIMAPIVPQIQRDLHNHSPASATLIVTIWELGEVIGPLFYGPLCEWTGRFWVMHSTNILFVIFAIGCACSTTMEMLIVMRFLGGASIAVTGIANGIVGDLFKSDERGLALSLCMLASQAGPVVGPIVGSYLGQAAGWRWVFWLTAIITGVASVGFALVYRETYRVVILDRKVRRMRIDTGNKRFRSKYDRSRGESSMRGLLQAVFRPVYLLSQSWVLCGVTALVSFFLGILYLALTTIVTVFQGIYGFSEGQTGLAFLGLCESATRRSIHVSHAF